MLPGVCDMFLILKTAYFTSYAGYNTPFALLDNTGDVIRSLEEVGENQITCFSDNQTKLNPEKCDWLRNTKSRPP